MIEHTMGYEFYIIEVCKQIAGFSKLVTFLSFAIFAIFCGIYCVTTAEGNEMVDIGVRMLKIAGCVFGISVLLSIFIPSSDTLYLILSESVAKEVESGKLPSRALDILNKRLEEYKGK